MFDVSKGEFQDALRQIERRLLKLSAGLATRRARRMSEFAMLALGHRARSAFAAFIAAAESAEGAGAAAILIRPAVEINLTLRFVVAEPELHAELWAAESERQSLLFVRKFVEDEELSAKHHYPFDLTEAWFTERDALVSEARSRALSRGVEGVGARGPLIPSVEVIAKKYGDLASREAYVLAYRPLSDELHVGARAFREEQFTKEEDGYVMAEHAPSTGSRALNATTFASTICILSEFLGLGVLDEAAALKEALLRVKIRDD